MYLSQYSTETTCAEHPCLRNCATEPTSSRPIDDPHIPETTQTVFTGADGGVRARNLSPFGQATSDRKHLRGHEGDLLPTLERTV